MASKPQPRLNPKKRYLQIALNSTLEEARKIIFSLPASDRIILEAGTPLIKRYGEAGIRQVRDWWAQRLAGSMVVPAELYPFAKLLLSLLVDPKRAKTATPAYVGMAPYVVADMKTIDRGGAEVEIAARAGASAVIAMGHAPPETLDSFIAACEERGIDAMIDMMNVEYPLAVLRELKKKPAVVILHRGVDEERLNKAKQIPLHEIRRIKGSYDMMIAVAGGDTPREVQRAVFNDADIVVVWKSVYQGTGETAALVEGFLRDIK